MSVAVHSRRAMDQRDRALSMIARHRQEHGGDLADERRAGDADERLADELASLYRAPLAAEAPEVTRVGLGYRATFGSAGVMMELQRIRETRGEVAGELTVRLAQDATGFGEGHLLYAARFLASSMTARASTGRYLNARVAGDWVGMLELFSMLVLREQRRGQEFEQVGQRARQSAERYLQRPLLPLGTSTILFGAGGTGKSTLAAGVTVATATGRPIIRGWDPTPGQVLVLDWEDGAATWNDRTAAIAAGIGAPAPLVHYRSMSRPLADDIEAIAAYVAEQCILLVIVDSLGLAAGATRDGDSVADGAFRLFAALRELGTTCLLVDHVAGADLDAVRPTSKPYGSVYKLNLARQAFELRQEREGDAERTELLLVHTKANASARLAPQGLAIVREDGAIRFERSDVEAPELVATLSIPERLLRLLRGGSMPTSMIATELETTESNVRSILTRDKGRRFVRLPDGRVGLASHAG